MSEVTITLRGAAADKLNRLMAEQKYARPEDAVADAIDALGDNNNPDLEAWLDTVVAARADAHEADPARGASADDVRKRLLSQD